MTGFPILPYPTFLSATINEYMKEIADQAGRYVIFVDLGKTNRSDVQATIDVPSELPMVAIYVDKTQINSRTYKPQLHNPLLAHEITHLQLNAEGWPKISFDVNVEQDVKNKLAAIENWLTDPLINQRIAKRGFSMGTNRNQEITLSVEMLRKRNWSYNQARLGISPIVAIRLFVSLNLEPEISRPVKASFREAFRVDLPNLFDEARALLDLIEKGGFDTPSAYQTTALSCIQAWGVEIQKIKFTNIQRYSHEEGEAWTIANPPEDNWDL